MKKLQVYLNFPGNCEEALDFYTESIGGNIKSKQTYGEAQTETPAKDKDKIMHSEFEADGMYFMACDAMPGQHDIKIGNNVSLTIDLDNEEEQTRIYNNLSKGGEQTMPLQDTFWGARFGMVKDKYGINWMLNHNKPQQ